MKINLFIFIVLVSYLIVINYTYGQDLLYTNEEVLVYSLPKDTTSDSFQAKVEKIAKYIAKQSLLEITSKVITEIAGKIIGFVFSFIQEIPTVGNPTRLEFDIIPNKPTLGYSKFNVAIMYFKGDWQGAWKGFSISLKYHKQLFVWEPIESRQLLSEKEIYKIPTNTLIILKHPFTVPNKLGTYRIEINGINEQFKITKVML